MIYFKKLRWKNFLSTGAAFTEIDFTRNNATLVLGVNGAGKSTMLDALTFSLFGKSFRGTNLPNLVNTVNEKELLVEVEFSIGVKQYKIQRGIKPAVFNIYTDGVLMNQDSKSTDYQDIFEKQILKFNYKAFTQTVILGSASFKPFMQLPAADRRVVIDELLDIEIFSAMNTVVKGKLAEIKEQMTSSKARLDSTNAKIELQRKHVEEAKKSTAELVARKQEQYEKYAAHIATLTANVALIQTHVDQYETRCTPYTSLLTRLNEIDRLTSQIQTKIKKFETDVKLFKDHSACPTCTQTIEQGFKVNAIQTANAEITTLNAALEQLKTQRITVSKSIDTISDLQNQIINHEREITRLNESISHTKASMKTVLVEIDDLRNRKVLSDDMTEVSVQLLKDLEEVVTLRRELTESKKYYDIAAALLKDNGIKTKIIRQYLPIINKLINKHLVSMDSFFNFEIDEEFKETIKSRYRDKFQYESFSEGEKFRIDISLLFTWRALAKLKNSIDTNLLILDEVFDGPLDAGGTDDLLKLLTNLAGSNVFVISPKGALMSDKFKSVIEFRKEGLFSRIV